MIEKRLFLVCNLQPNTQYLPPRIDNRFTHEFKIPLTKFQTTTPEYLIRDQVEFAMDYGSVQNGLYPFTDFFNSAMVCVGFVDLNTKLPATSTSAPA